MWLARGSLTAIRYRDEILRPLVRPYAGAVGPGFLLMQDNARPHVAGVCQQFLQDEGIDAMDWPARSPDLNPIEHIWDIMSRSIHQRHVAPQTVQELADALVQVWEEIPQETIRHLIRSMPRHIKVKEQSVENMMRGRKIYEPPRFMTVSQAADQLIQIVQRRREEGAELGVTEDTVCVGVARLGADDQVIRTGTLHQLASCDLGSPLHSLIVTGRLHPLEVDMLRVNAEPNALQHLRMLDSSTYCS
ncbi:hypothetical protein L3Q82_008100 [Scortum barcoo]|uniref:Uncharacterized protein n=1 Tax=Scortum barcoo TaxID=214431 RepID=A0ACB8WLC0_9TELE|nr:hypothetical protein L3Q82_008100 [Scortum barcoo]